MTDSRFDWELPPVLGILLREVPKLKDSRTIIRVLDDMQKELTDQAEWTAMNFDYAENIQPRIEEFVAVPASGMDPFGFEGACENLDCRIDASARFARSVGLFSNLAVVSDPFTSFYLGRERRLNVNERMALLTRLAVAKQLEPMLRSGVIQFRSPYALICNTCLSGMDPQVEAIAEQFVAQHRRQMKVTRWSPNTLAIDVGDLIKPSLVLRHRLTKSSAKIYEDPKKRRGFVTRVLKDVVKHEARRMIVDSSLASHLNGVVLSNSRIDAEAMLSLEMRRPPDIELWERQRSAQLPWVRDLSPIEILHLREEAASALPRLRAKLASALRLDQEESSQPTKSVHAIVGELREDAAEVKSELAGLTLGKGKAVRTTASVLGVGVALYGLAADMPAISFATLFGVLGLVHTLGRREEHEAAKLTARPGYVLVQAERLLAHRHEQ